MGDVKVRKAALVDAPAIARVHVASWKSTYAGILPEEFLASLAVDDREKMWSQVLGQDNGRTHVLVAELERFGVVGFAALGPERAGDEEYDSELSAIYILEEHQRRGAGQLLFRAGVNALAEDGYNSMLLWVLSQNPACRFYEAMGGVPVRSRTISVGGQTYEEIGYGWRDGMPVA